MARTANKNVIDTCQMQQIVTYSSLSHIHVFMQQLENSQITV